MRVLGYVGALAVMAGGNSCSYPMTNPPPLGPAAIIVHNESDLDVDVYVWDGWERATRLGFLSAKDTLIFEVPAEVTVAPGPYYLEARGVDGAEYPTQSETFALRPGYRITWAIPPVDMVGAADGAIADTSHRPQVPPERPSVPVPVPPTKP